MSIDDSARGLPMKPATALAASLDLVGRKVTPTATCPQDGAPLIMTFEMPGAEFLCMECGQYSGFLAPVPADPTPELDARYLELKARFDAGERPGQRSCRVCGCTDLAACPGRCSWVELDLCSSCA